MIFPASENKIEGETYSLASRREGEKRYARRRGGGEKQCISWAKESKERFNRRPKEEQKQQNK